MKKQLAYRCRRAPLTVASAILGFLGISPSVIYNCEPVGEPQLFPGPHPEWHRNFTAEATVFCGP